MTAKSRKSANHAKSPLKRTTTSEKPASTKNTRRAKAPEPAPASIAKSKQQRCLDLLARRDGATLAELMTVTEWQPHSVRGFPVRDREKEAWSNCSIRRATLMVLGAMRSNGRCGGSNEWFSHRGRGQPGVGWPR
jgi:hypothetical protein